MLGNTDVSKSPFNVASYTEQFIADQQAKTASQALILDPSVRATQTTGGQVDSFFIRGFPYNEGNSGEIAFDGLYGIAPNFKVFTDYAQRIEVLKGPSAAVSGVAPNGGVGGVINIVPKRAGEELTRLTLDYTSVGRPGGQWDIARRAGEGREWGARFSGSVRSGDTAFDRQSETSGVGYLALDYQGERLRTWLYLLAQTDRYTAPVRPFLAASGILIPRAPGVRRNVSQPWEYSNIDDFGSLFKAEYDLNSQITLFGDVGGSTANVNRFFSLPNITNNLGFTSSLPQFFGQDVDRYTYDAGVRAKFDTGFIRHSLVFQGSVFHDEIYRRLTNGTTYISNIYDPVVAREQSPVINTFRPRLSMTTLTGVSIADTLSVLNDGVSLTGGVRRQRIEVNNYTANVGTLASAYDASKTTPFAGLVIRPVDGVSLYGNYIEGLSRGDVAPTGSSNVGEVLPPYVARQYEAGIKLDFGGFGTSFSAFQITRPNGELSAGRFAATGEVRVSGVELFAYGVVTPGVRVLGGVTLLDGELKRTAVAANVGNVPIGVPDMQLNVGAEWDLLWVRGLTVDGAVIYTSKQFVNLANTQRLPDWTRVDVGARYTTVVSGYKTTFRASVQNVANANYWTGVASFGTFFQAAPRTYLLSAAIDF